jgi:exopolysaccharide production protein ExoY
LNFGLIFLISIRGSEFAMLIQMPRGSKGSPGSQNAEECDAFEAGLRRDLATAPVVSYETTLGGWPKRTLDIFLTILSAPIWLTVMLCAALWSKARHAGPVFVGAERIGYGGHPFRCLALRLEPPSAVVEQLHGEHPAPANDWAEIARKAEDGRAKWRRAIEGLPQLWNVLRGEMSLVGPNPLTREELEPLRTAKRYYLSARPGVIGVRAIVSPEDEPSSQYKAYALSWTVTTDLLLMWDALRSLRNRGELWRPLHIGKAVEGHGTAVRRRGETPG